MAQYIDKSALVAEIEKIIADETESIKSFEHNKNVSEVQRSNARIGVLTHLRSLLNTLDVKEVDVSSISENLAEAYEYLDYTHTSNLAHNKPMIAARLRNAIKELYSVGLLKLTHDEKYRIESLGLKAQKGE